MNFYHMHNIIIIMHVQNYSDNADVGSQIFIMLTSRHYLEFMGELRLQLYARK